jgi:hypothetical protein
VQKGKTVNQPDGSGLNLCQLARLERNRSFEQRSYWQDVSLLKNDYEIWDVARQQRGVVVLERSLAFPTFFTAGAEEVLMTLPNNFWFWSVVYSATSAANGGLIDEVNIRQVIASFRARRSSVYDLNKPLEQLSPFDMAVRVIEGVILLKSSDCEHLKDVELVFNVMFQPQAEG